MRRLVPLGIDLMALTRWQRSEHPCCASRDFLARLPKARSEWNGTSFTFEKGYQTVS
jgi:hypothetical protein